MKAAIYCRISMDREKEGEGVERQLEDCRQLCEARGWTVVAEYIDNDVSAFSGAKRPAFELMLNELDADTLVVWKSDRLARRGKDLQRFLDLNVTLTSCTEPEFTGSTGLLMLRILAGFAEHESGVKSERVARKMRSKAERGDPHAGGKRCFGYTADGTALIAEESSIIQDAARRILAGETVTDVFRGRRVPCGSVSNFKRLLRSPRLIGMREVAGQLVEGNFPAILDRSTWERLAVLVKTKHRDRPKARTHLLTGLLYCGRCGTAMHGSPQGYRCPTPLLGGCGRISVASERAEDWVTRIVLAAIPEQNLEGGTEDEVELLLNALRQVEADVAQLAKDHYVEKRIGRPAYLAANDELEARCELLRSQIAEHQGGKDLGSLKDIAETWEHQTVSWRQAVLRAVLERVVVAPATSTRAPVGERLELRWRA